MKETIRILLVDDHEVVRLGLRTLLMRHTHLRVVDEAADAKLAVEKTMRYKPHVVLTDLRLSGGTGIEAIRTIIRRCPKTRVLVLTAFSDDQLLIDAITAGASGYLLKEIQSENLVHAIEKVMQGESILDPRVTKRVLKRLAETSQKQADEPFKDLTWQEKRILALVAEGMGNREIGVALNLSEKTIRNYVSQILSKLNFRSRTQAAAYAVRHHLDATISLSKTR